MDLFHMRRYTGDDGGETVDDVAEVSAHKGQAEILAELKNRIEKKRKKKKEEASEDAVADKKPKLDGGKDVAEEKIEQDGQEDKKGKKKRKRKKKGVDADDEDPSATGFTVLGEKMDRSKSKVRRVLPAWLANPDVVSVDYSEDQMPVEKLAGLDSKSVADLKANGIANFFPVQRQVIPRLLPPKKGDLFRPSDVCVSAPTGSGKTLAFVLPIVQALRNRVVTRIRALVILPVQDLATQVYRVFQIYAADSGLKVKLLTPQRSFAQEQNELVRRGIVGDLHSLTDIIVTTPGRLVDHIQNTEGFSLEHLRYLVIDEADRVMEDIQNDWLTHVESAVYTGSRNRPGPLTVENASKGELPLQKLLFSATLSQNPEQLEQLNLFEPKLFTSVVKPKDILQEPVKEGEGDNFEFIGQYTTPAELSESMVVCKDSLKKPQILHHLLVTKQMKKVLVFTKSLEHTHFLALLLKEYGLSVAELSSQTGAKRNRVLNKFSSGKLDILVCSDALARGIDIGQIDFVICYDCPGYVKTYIHRVGRTARAGRTGSAITLAEAKEEKKFRAMLKEAGKESTVAAIEVDEEALDKEQYEAAAKRAGEAIAAETAIEREKKRAGRMKNRKKKN